MLFAWIRLKRYFGVKQFGKILSQHLHYFCIELSVIGQRVRALPYGKDAVGAEFFEQVQYLLYRHIFFHLAGKAVAIQE